jgi:hypothetical protein
MRTRTILGALGAGVLAAVALSAPASAATVMSPTVAYTDRCDMQGSFKAHVTLPINAETATVRVTKNGVLLNGGYPTPVSAGGAFDYDFDNAIAEKGTIVLEWSSGGGTFAPLEANSTHTWAAPGNCKPVVTIHQPTCDDPSLSVGIFNPGDKSIKVTFNSNAAATVASGSSISAQGAVKTDVKYGWDAPDLGLSDVKTVKYVAPTGCAAGKPGVSPTPEAPSIHEGKGRPEHVSWKNHHGTTATTTTTAPAGAETTTTAPAGAVTTTKTTTKAAATGKDNLAVTGTNTKAIVGVGFLLFAGGLVLLLAIRRRRQVRFTA